VDPSRRHLALVGLSGSGKSSVAPILATRLALLPVDLDERISGATGSTVPELFDRVGETPFRWIESRILESVLDGPDAVIATGGGVVLASANRRALRARCRVVWLRTPIDVLVARLAVDDQERPLLRGDAATSLRRLSAEREALYAEVADVVVDTGVLEPEAVADAVEEELEGD